MRADLKNDSPTSGYPPYVIGPYKSYSTQAGENVAVVDLYCDRGCILQGGSRNGEPVELERYASEGYPYFEDYVRTPSGDTATIEARLLLTDAGSALTRVVHTASRSWGNPRSDRRACMWSSTRRKG